uniref:uncharacterized protein LOC120342466 n=1 Tax=Styela clava TaxID=7725 RepID=UPI00193AA222|nr:uncharacterized protein LOC120342466 [Styela clava]
MEKAPETPTSSTARRSQKRPHSPQDERSLPADTKSQTADPGGSILESETKTNKLLRLLGGKKRKNETAASKWLERVRSREDELKVSTELESQFNESLTHKLTGQSRRHVGIGFHEETSPPVLEKTESHSGNANNNTKEGEIISKLSESSDSHGASGSISKPDSAPKGILDSLSGRAKRPGIYVRHSVPRPQESASSVGTKESQKYPSLNPPEGASVQGRYQPENTGNPKHENSSKSGYPNSQTGNVQNSGSLAPPSYSYGQTPRSNLSAPPRGYGTNYSSMVPSGGFGQNQGFNSGTHSQGYRSVEQFVPSKPRDVTEKPNPVPKSKSAFYSQFKKAS